MSTRFVITSIIFFSLASIPASYTYSQSFGPELRNTVMPASGAMGGASLARPQDLQSAINGNPATMARFYGTQFSNSGAWIESTFNVSHVGGNLPNLGDFVSAKNNAQGAALGNIGITQDFRAYGLPVTVGMGLLGTSGAGLSLRNEPASNGTSALIQVLGIGFGAGVDITDRLSAGGTFVLGSAVLDAPFVGVGAATTDYALRGSVGLAYDLGCRTTLGCYYQSKMNFNFDDAIQLQLLNGNLDVVRDINMDMPDNIGIGVANESLMGGKLLLATDVLFIQWKNADLFAPIYTNQWVIQCGAQYKLSRRVRLRAGYVFAENATEPNPGDSAGGVTPGVEAIQYLQAELPNINQHRISAGVGIRDILPGVDMDLFGGGMPRESENYGEFTSVNLQSYWVGFGLTWRFGRGACCRLPATDDDCFNLGADCTQSDGWAD